MCGKSIGTKTLGERYDAREEGRGGVDRKGEAQYRRCWLLELEVEEVGGVRCET